MKRLTLNSFLLVALFVLFACEEDTTLSSFSDPITPSVTSKLINTPDYITFEFNVKGKKDGLYKVGINPYTQSSIKVLVANGEAVRYQVFRKDGSLVIPVPTQKKPGTPVNSNKPQVICLEGVKFFYDPTYGYLIQQYGDCDPGSGILEIIVSTRY